MWIQVRGMVGGKVEKISNLSRTTPIAELRKRLRHWADPECLRLFCKGKEMLDEYTLFDYNIGLNDMVLVLIKKPVDINETKASEKEKIEEDIIDNESEKENIKENETTNIRENNETVTMSKKEETRETVLDSENKDLKDEDIGTSTSKTPPTFKPGDVVDVREEEMGAWFEADILEVTNQSQEDAKNNTDLSDGYSYDIKFEGDDEVTTTTSNNIRPRAHYKIPLKKLKVNDKVMLNYNYSEPKERGYWYDAVITSKESKKVKATVYVGKELIEMKDCNIVFVDEIFSIPSAPSTTKPPIRASKPDCDACLDNPRVRCKECSCTVCGGKNNPHLQLLCDECGLAYHISCLTPSLETIPKEDEWFCPDCKLDKSVVVGAGEKLKESIKKSKMASATCKKDWGKGMACVGRSKVCTIVSQTHFGEIPGVEVGTLWKYRMQVSEAGVHRPHVAGIHGRENEGAYSIVLSGGYEDDKDDGEEFTYTGSGGRDLSGNKRTAEQSCDQVLNRMNKALAKNCDAPINNKGAEAVDWKKGKPVRVVRNCKGRKHSKYAPEDGNRYDGIYKVVKYWPEKGKSGFLVWKYLLRRHDEQPPPWTEEGQQRTARLGLVMQYPDGYEEKEAKKNLKRKNEEEKEEEDDDEVEKQDKKNKTKKSKNGSLKFEPDGELMDEIKQDVANEKMWKEALEAAEQGKKAMLDFLETVVTCIYCQELPYHPITTQCLHNFCKNCLERSFKAGVTTCGMCRQELKDEKKGIGNLKENLSLAKALRSLFPGYEVGR